MMTQPGDLELGNRSYANVIPLPETRVVLQRQGDDDKTEYINANYVRVSNRGAASPGGVWAGVGGSADSSKQSAFPPSSTQSGWVGGWMVSKTAQVVYICGEPCMTPCLCWEALSRPIKHGAPNNYTADETPVRPIFWP